MHRAVAVAFCAVALSLPVAAQSAQCSAQPVALRDACQKGTDIFTMLAPQVHAAIAGGGPVLASARAVNGLSVGLRINAVDARIPDPSSTTLSTGGAVQGTIATSRVPLPAPVLDFAFSAFPGVFLGAQRVLSVEVLANVAYVPNRSVERFRVRTTDGSLKLGYGARVGLLSDRLLMPAVSISYFRRSLPTSAFSTSFSNGSVLRTSDDSLTLNSLSIRNDALRLAISKRLGVFEIGGGAGQDTYHSFASLQTRVTPPVGVPVNGGVALTQQIKRNTAYASFALNISRLRIGAEAGATFGGDSIATYNTFTDGKLNDRRLFGSLGTRVSF
ncbi:MAG TPA: hypothetical protein VE861_14000 [Gemmatimonadaceae bacterium]|nr:hypothetical protein [Gemmatimonadaceae bacterium]